ncbi:MAG: MmcQ/YjbR family DNA-binding protein [Lachnospiraceae bacterium]|nr:MmcQ/YjbR family DNA-binding protein [Lachnospiraceae bacterium]
MVNREDILKYTVETYGIASVRLWAKTPTNEVWRHETNGKWFAIIMEIPENRVGLSEDALIDVMNVKCEPEMAALLSSQPGFAPAYHMNKIHWVSILLNGTVPDETIYQLLDMSYEMTAGRKKS